MRQLTLDQQVAQLTDRHAITDLIYQLGVALDEGGFDQMPGLFTEDATVTTPGGTARGRAALVAQAERNHTPDERIQHVISDVLIDVNSTRDRAQARANLLVHFAPSSATAESHPAPAVSSTQGQIYRFEAVRMTDGWRLSSVAASPVWISGARPARARA